MRKVKIQGLRSPVALNKPEKYAKYIGKVAELKGNAYHGFEFKMPDGEWIFDGHFFYEHIND